MSKVDLKTEIPCPTCNENVVHRYNCQCEDYWGYCKNQDGCRFFFCLNCDEEQKVEWNDNPQEKARQARIEEDYVVLPLDQEEQLREKFGRGFILPGKTWSDTERTAIRKMLDDITTPGFLEKDVPPDPEIAELVRLEEQAAR